MPLWTKRQKNYVRSIEKLVGVPYDGQPTRKDADIYIKEHQEEHRELKKQLGLDSPPTGKQARFIKVIEETLCIKFEGQTIIDACEFIDKNINEFKINQSNESKMKYRIKNIVDRKLNEMPIL